MKKTLQFLGLALALMLSITTTAQIKVFSGGGSIAGSTSVPLNGAKFQVTGRTYFSTATGTVTATSAAYIRSTQAFTPESTPDYTWYKDSTTGIFHPAVKIIGFTINGAEKLRLNINGKLLSASSSDATKPEYTWKGDSATGMYRSGAGAISFSLAGTEKLKLNGQVLAGGNGTGSAATPDFSWVSNSNTGMFRSGSSALGFATNGTQKMNITSTGQLQSMNGPATAGTPDFSWNADPNTGVFNPAGDVIGIATGGTERMRINSSGQLLINTTSATANEKLKVIAASGDNYAARFEVNHNSDWIQTVVTIANKPNSSNYVVRYNNDTARFYVAGSGWIYSAGNYLGSDMNIKDDIHNIDSAMYKINHIRGVTYKLKEEKQSPEMFGGVAHTYMGVIAQEVEAVAPQVVKIIHNGTKAVCYEMLVGLLIQGMKEQDQKIAQLQSDLNNCCTAPGTGGRTSGTGTNPENRTISGTASWLAQNKPNPFSSQTVIEYNVIEEGSASIMVFDMNGKLLKTLIIKIPGKGSVTINGNDLVAGMYYYSLVVNGKEVDTKKMILTE